MIDIHGSRWAVRESFLPALADRFRQDRGEMRDDAPKRRAERLSRAEQYAATAQSRTAVIPIHGVIEYSPCWFGSVSCQEISLMLDVFAARPDVDRIILDIDSPGGVSYGVMELADKIHAIRSQKEIVAVANCMACSAAHWIGSAASKFFAMASGDVGSIGVYMMHVDQSKLMDEVGVKISFVQAGLYKTDGHPYAPLTDTARESMQGRVNEDYVAFIGALAKFRGRKPEYIEANFGQGKVVSPLDAIRVGMIDGIGSVQQLLTQSQAAKKGMGASKTALRDSERRQQNLKKQRLGLEVLKLPA